MSDATRAALPVVLVVDDEQPILFALRRLLRNQPIEVVAVGTPHEALAVLTAREVAVLLTDYMMPGMNGIELLALVRQRWPRTIGILMTACSDIRLAASAVNQRLIRAFITKPWDATELRAQVNDAVQAFGSENSPQTETLIRLSIARDVAQKATAAAFSLARAMDARDPHTHRHAEKVAHYALLVGRALGLDDAALEELRVGGLLHDIGKIGVPDAVLLKDGPLDPEERATIQRHPQVGASIIEPLHFAPGILTVVRHHHENLDGTGYPDRLSGAAIQMPARIVRVVDAYDAMASNRVYRRACSQEHILNELRVGRGTQFDPAIADILIGLLQAGDLDRPPEPMPG